MCPQGAWIRACIITLVAFVWLFSTVCFQMCHQSACIRGCIVTLVAFVWLFTSVCFHMSPQMAFLGGCIVTLFAFVRLFSTVTFQMSPQIVCVRGCKVTLIAFVWLFSNVSSNCLPEKRHSHIGCSCLTFLHCLFLSLVLLRWYNFDPSLLTVVLCTVYELNWKQLRNSICCGEKVKVNHF